MRDTIDFYRRNPFVLALVLVVGTGVSVAVAVTANGVILPIALVALIGLLVGLGIAAYRRGPE